ncbi:MAG: MarR family transcriptional regulator [Bacteroidia bacterium]|nr:MarR family transcriptional regulator [Bacteroidia bacterium]
MSLEREIKQEKFSSEYQKLAVNIAFTNAYLTSLLSKNLKPHDISMQQYNVLRILRGQHPNPVSINSITDRMIDKMSNASRLVEKLRKKSMVERKTCTVDRRQVDVCITNKGLEVLSVIDDTMENFDHMFNHVSIEDAQSANSILDKLRNSND